MIVIVTGGFAKAPRVPPDLLHSFYSVCWLSLAKEFALEDMDVALGVTKRTAAHIRARIERQNKSRVHDG